METKYDSANDTMNHIQTVQRLMLDVVGELAKRSLRHDRSKLEEPEKSMYDEYTPQLKGLTYGSDEYKAVLAKMGEALKHHYEHNSHHPEHYEHGVADMTLLDIVEMIVDWKAATLRHTDGDLMASLKINQLRFGISDQLFDILVNTVMEMEW